MTTANKLFFFNDHFYTAPMDTYNFGIVAAPDKATAYASMGTTNVDLLELGTTDVSGQVVCAIDTRGIDPRIKDEPRITHAQFYVAKEGSNFDERMGEVRQLIATQYGFPEDNIGLDFSRMLKIDGECTSSGQPLWRSFASAEGYQEKMPIFLTFEGEDAENFEPIDEFEDYEYHVRVDLPLTPVWLLVDLTEKHSLYEEDYAGCAMVARNVAYRSEETEGFERIEEVFGNHTLVWWLDPNWKELIEIAVVDYAKQCHEQRKAKEAAAEEPKVDGAVE